MDEFDVTEKIKTYAKLQRQKSTLEDQLKQLRTEIIDYCTDRQYDEFQSGKYRVKLIRQERKNYDDQKLYAALPDPELWRLVSKADPAKIAGLLKLNVITENQLADTFEVKQIILLKIEN